MTYFFFITDTEKPRSERGFEEQKAAYLEAYMAQHLQQKPFRYDTGEQKKKTEENGCDSNSVSHSGPPDATFTVPDDGLGYDDGVRVLRTLGSWYGF